MFGRQVIVGGTASKTVTVYEQVFVFPAASRAVYVTVVTPVLNMKVPRLFIPVVADVPVVAPVSAHVKPVTAQLSPVVGLGVVTDAVQEPTPVFVEMFAGQLTVGAMLSVTVIV